MHLVIPPADEDPADHCADRAEHGEEEDAVRGVPGGRELRHDESGDQAAERHSRLPNAECEAPLASREPVHHRSAAGRVHTRPRSPREGEQDDQ